MKEPKDVNKIYCIFSQSKEGINEKIGKVFEIYLKEQKVTKDKLENKEEIY